MRESWGKLRKRGRLFIVDGGILDDERVFMIGRLAAESDITTFSNLASSCEALLAASWRVSLTLVANSSSERPLFLEMHLRPIGSFGILPTLQLTRVTAISASSKAITASRLSMI